MAPRRAPLLNGAGRDADLHHVDRCAACGAVLSTGAGWCGQCFAARPDGPPPAATLPGRVRWSRWRRTQTTFGPVGRIVATLALLLPMWFFWETQLFGWPGLVIWGLFLLPWGLRETWRRARLPLS